MPAESTSRSFETEIVKPLGITVPGRATGTRSPALKFFAPQTIWRIAPASAQTVHRLTAAAGHPPVFLWIKLLDEFYLPEVDRHTC